MDFRLRIAERDGKVFIDRSSDYEPPQQHALIEDEARSKLIVSTNRTTGVLPPVVRYISGTGRHILLERPPQVMQFKYYGKPKSDIEGAQLQEMELPLPWTLYAIGLDAKFRPYFTYMFGTQKMITSEQDILFALPVPNCEMNGKFCTPYPKWGDDPEPWSISEGINTAYTTIWNSNFNTDITSNITQAYRQRQPKAIFDGKGDRRAISKNDRYKPSNLFRRWEEFTLNEVGEWDDWIPAIWPDANPLRVHNVLYMLRNAEREYNSGFMYNTVRQRLM